MTLRPARPGRTHRIRLEFGTPETDDPSVSFNLSYFGMFLRLPFICAVAILVCSLGVHSSQAQPPNRRQLQQQQREFLRKQQQQVKDAAAAAPALPADPKLLTLHKEFITKAQKLAEEYERKKQFDRAREVYQSVVRLVPGYGDAENALKRILQFQSLQDRQLVAVQATQGWQDSGIKLQKGMPVRTDVKGTWRIVIETTHDGIQIPEEQRLRDPKIRLGSLLAVIADSISEIGDAKPFVVKPGDEFVADKSGRLFFRMYDIDPSDNDGEIAVLVQSTFAK